MDNSKGEIQEIFLSEAKQQLFSLQELLLDTEDNGTFSFERVAELFRLVHTLKGSAAMVGYTVLSQITHKYENILSILRDKAEKHLTIEEKQIKQVISLGLDFSDTYLDAVMHPGEYAQAESFASLEQALIKTLQSLGGQSQEKNATVQKDAYPPELWLYERVHVTLIHCGMAYLRAFMFQQAVLPLCIKTYTIPANLNTRPELQNEILEKGFELGFMHKKGVDSKEILDVLRRQPMFKSVAPLAHAKTAKTAAKSSTAKMLSVKGDSVTRLLGLVTEAMAAQTLLIQHLRTLNVSDAYIEKSLKKLQRCTQGIQRGLDDMGLLELGQVFLPVKRLIRKLLAETGKQAETIFFGGTVMVERGVLDALNEALLHLIRNAVDHGIESPEERQKAGKSLVGRIQVSAHEERERLIVTVEDDGHGIDREKVLQKAQDRGMLTKPPKEYTKEEIYKFILQSGFSTNDKVTQTSGRGVGMDVVHDALKKIGGYMEIRSEEGKGSCITLNLPVSLSVIKALRVQMHEREVFIPSSMISKVVALAGTETISQDGRLLLGAASYIMLEPKQDEKYMVLFQVGTENYCLPCQALKSYETVFVKALPKMTKELLQEKNIYLGCFIDSLGKVRCILDVNLLIQRVQVKGEKT